MNGMVTKPPFGLLAGTSWWVFICVCVCVCVRERERERERGATSYVASDSLFDS